MIYTTIIITIPDISKCYSPLIKFYAFLCSVLKTLSLFTADPKHIKTNYLGMQQKKSGNAST